jgi:hypothetical protein
MRTKSYAAAVLLLTVMSVVPAFGAWGLVPELMPSPPSGADVDAGGCLAYDAGTDLIFASKGNKTGDFYAFDVNASVSPWSTRTSIPLGAEGKQVDYGSAMCADANGRFYLTKGNNTLGFSAYDAPTNAWTQKTNVPLGPNNQKVQWGADIVWAVSGGIGSAYLLKGKKNEFYRYDPVTNEWTTLPNAPPEGNGNSYDKGSWLAYDGNNTIYAFRAQANELHEYKIVPGQWDPNGPLDPMPGPPSGDGGCGVYHDGYIYALKGGSTTQFWRYGMNGVGWVNLSSQLNGLTVGPGADIVARGVDLYATEGNKTRQLWKY